MTEAAVRITRPKSDYARLTKQCQAVRRELHSTNGPVHAGDVEDPALSGACN
jgi:hypothetical protein